MIYYATKNNLSSHFYYFKVLKAFIFISNLSKEISLVNYIHISDKNNNF
jgi:hypothetical protein